MCTDAPFCADLGVLNRPINPINTHQIRSRAALSSKLSCWKMLCKCIKFMRKHCKKREIDCQTDRRSVYQAVRVLWEWQRLSWDWHVLAGKRGAFRQNSLENLLQVSLFYKKFSREYHFKGFCCNYNQYSTFCGWWQNKIRF